MTKILQDWTMEPPIPLSPSDIQTLSYQLFKQLGFRIEYRKVQVIDGTLVSNVLTQLRLVKEEEESK